MPKLEPNRVILWMEDDVLVPDAESIDNAYKRITNEGAHFNFDPHGHYPGRTYLRSIIQGGHHRIKVIKKEEDDISSTYHLSNGISITFSGERCSCIFVRTNQG